MSRSKDNKVQSLHRTIGQVKRRYGKSGTISSKKDKERSTRIKIDPRDYTNEEGACSGLYRQFLMIVEDASNNFHRYAVWHAPYKNLPIVMRFVGENSTHEFHIGYRNDKIVMMTTETCSGNTETFVSDHIPSYMGHY